MKYLEELNDILYLLVNRAALEGARGEIGCSDKLLALKQDVRDLFAKATGWTKMEDETPEPSTRVLVTNGSIKNKAFYVAGEFYTDRGDKLLFKVTHWMKMPDAPED